MFNGEPTTTMVMNIAIVLYTTGEFQVVGVSDTEDYQKYLNCDSLQLLDYQPVYVYSHDHGGFNQPPLSCYANGDAIQDGLAPNIWSGFLKSVGVMFENDEDYVFGDILLLSENTEYGDDQSIDPYTFDRIRHHHRCGFVEEGGVGMDSINMALEHIHLYD